MMNVLVNQLAQGKALLNKNFHEKGHRDLKTIREKIIEEKVHRDLKSIRLKNQVPIEPSMAYCNYDQTKI